MPNQHVEVDARGLPTTRQVARDILALLDEMGVTGPEMDALRAEVKAQWPWRFDENVEPA